MKPEDLAKSGTEHGHQVALMIWCQQNLDKWPELKWLFAIPNGGLRNITTASRMKAEGQKSGVPDLFLPVVKHIKNKVYDDVACSGLFIELKRPASVGKAGGKISEEQEEWINHLQENGYRVMICVGWEAARDALIEYLEMK